MIASDANSHDDEDNNDQSTLDPSDYARYQLSSTFFLGGVGPSLEDRIIFSSPIKT